MKAFNKIGFHTASGGNPTGIGEYLKKLDAANVPFVIKCADSMTGLFEAQELMRKRNGAVPHVLAYRRSVPDGGSRPPSGNPDVPDYLKEPEKAAEEHWQWHKAHLPSDLDPKYVWIETINELRKEVEWADWIGEFAYFTGQMALADGYKFSAFGYSSGTPDEGAWETDGMLRYLESCQAHPNELSVALHEYSFKSKDIWFLRGDHIGRFEKLFAACDKHRLKRPNVLITEWGWTHERVPGNVDDAMKDIADVAAYYAKFPEILGAAIWYLGPGFAGIANRAQKLIKPVTEYSLTTVFEIPDAPETPDPVPPPMTDPVEGNLPNGRYLRDVNVPDDSVMTVGTTFTKTWLVENTGNTTWNQNYHITHINGEPMTPDTGQPVPAAKPGEQVEVSVNLTVPDTPGTHFSDWRLQDDKQNLFGDVLFTRIIAEAPVSQPGGNADGKFVADVTIPDDTEIQPGKPFTKTWQLKNSGTRAWGQGFTMKFAGGMLMSAKDTYPLPAAKPGQVVDVSIDMVGPTNPGTHYADWRLHDDKGGVFGEIIYVRIVVPWQPGSSLVTPVSQRDSRWADKRLGMAGSTLTISKWGCLMTCFAMTANTYGHPVTPAQLNDLMVRKGGFIDVNLTKWNALSVVYPDIIYGGKMESSPTTLAHIDASLAEGRPVSVQVDFTSNTPYTDNDQHWVLIVAKDGDDYRINDPWLLPEQEASLKQRYGRAERPLWEAILSAIFYRSTKVIPAPTPVPPTDTTPILLQTGMNVNPDAPNSNPHQTDDFKGLDWVRFVFKLDARVNQAERGNITKSFDQYDPIIKDYNKMGVKSLLVINQETVWGKAPWRGNNDWQGYAADLAGRAKEIADHYKRYGDQVAYQIWNEGDKKNNPASVYLEPDQMALIVDKVAEAIRSASPDSPIIFNGMATGPEESCAYLKKVEMKLGGKIPVDAIGIHPYTRWAIKAPFDWGKQFGTLEDAFAVYRREMPGYKFWITEIGIADDNEIGSQFYTEIGEYMRNVYKYTGDRSTDLVEVLIWFAWSDWMRNAGVVKTDGSRKDSVYPAFRSVRNREL
ncbi:MAG: cellulase family glycosylhydrolase [Anaerolineae bacterium]|nr:cellulase family glycosylhydrolase [Anaerolineae bacterium]